VFVLLATRGHDILYSDWGRRYSIDLYIALTLTLQRTTAHVLLSYHKYCYRCFNYCQ